MTIYETHFEVTNNWDDKQLTDDGWVNDGREASKFQSLQEASDVADTENLQFGNTLYVSLIVTKEIDEELEIEEFPVFSKAA